LSTCSTIGTVHARPDFGRDSSPWPQERLLVEGGRAPAQREQLAAAAQAGERDGDVERPVLLRVRRVGELDDLFGREEVTAPVVVDGLELLDSGGWLVD
jgi:hypothetical protein